jgi:hypothetical protein
MRRVLTGGSSHDKGGMTMHRMRRIGFGGAALAAAALLLVTQMGAASTPRAHAATVNTFSVPGVINDADLATVFSCTNSSTTATASVTVTLFKEDGEAGPTATDATVFTRATPDFTTSAVKLFGGGREEFTLGAETTLTGWARITASPGVFCDAWVVDAVNNPPKVMMNLPVIKGTAQKGV